MDTLPLVPNKAMVKNRVCASPMQVIRIRSEKMIRKIGTAIIIRIATVQQQITSYNVTHPSDTSIYQKVLLPTEIYAIS